MTERPTRPLFLLALVAKLVACVGDVPLLGPADGGACQPTTESVQRTVFAPNCSGSGCHDARNPTYGLDLVSPGLEARVIGAASVGCDGERMVVPGDPERSQLYVKIAQAMPECGRRMPQGAPPLSVDHQACVADWIRGLSAGPADAAVDAPVAPADGSMDATTDARVEPVMDVAADGMTCPTGQGLCGGACVDTRTSGSHCGACDQTCGAGQSCVAGVCACGVGLTLCAGACVDTDTSASNCGVCGRTCGVGQVCAAGACSCSAGLALCGGACVNAQTSSTHCGSCGNACGAGFVCNVGVCTRGACTGGSTSCAGSCANLSVDPSNCGACGRSCASGQTCTSGVCTSSCASGVTLCAGGCANLQTDASNCGACGRACAAGQSCAAGSCGCPTGQALCGTTCVSLQTDPSNCGVCGRACTTGQTCAAGVCTSSCAGGTTLCSGSCVSLQTDNANCGACARACTAGQTCTAGVCTSSCGPSVSLSTQVQPIFTASCTTGCHGGPRPAAGMSLSSGASFGSLVGVASSACASRVRVVRGSVSTSYLISKLTGVGLCSGGIMPVNGGPLPSSQIDLIRAWICNGAPNN